MPNTKSNGVTTIQKTVTASTHMCTHAGLLRWHPEDFDGIAVKRFLLSQAREHVAWYW